MSSALFLGAQTAQAQVEWKATTDEQIAKTGQESIEGVFRFKNASKETVSIEKVITSCTCVTAKASKSTFAPNEEGEVKYKFRLEGRTGRKQKDLIVMIGDPAGSEIVLTIIANIK